MPLSVSYSSVNTKARALFGKLLTREDYEELAGKKSVTDVAVYLKKKTGYAGLLSDINENTVHRGELEKLFSTSLYKDFFKFLCFLRGRPAQFLREVLLRYEIQDLKVLLRITATNRNTETVADSLIFLKLYSRLDYDALIKSRDVAGLIKNLKGTQYYPVLAPFADKREPPNLFDMEMNLDLHFFMTILKRLGLLLTGADKRAVARSLGIEIDLLNIMWMYRCKKLFGLSKEVTLNHVVPHWFYLRREELIRLAGSKDADEFKELVSKTKYAALFKAEQESLWEKSSEDYLYRVYKSQLRRDYFNIGTMMAYISLKEIDIKNVITLIEGIRYALPREEVKSLLVGVFR